MVHDSDKGEIDFWLQYSCSFPLLQSQCGMIKYRDEVHGPQCSHYGTNECA